MLRDKHGTYFLCQGVTHASRMSLYINRYLGGPLLFLVVSITYSYKKLFEDLTVYPFIYSQIEIFKIPSN